MSFLLHKVKWQTRYYLHVDTREKIKYDDYRLMSEERRKEYNVYPKLQVYNVFNVAQTNLQEARP